MTLQVLAEYASQNIGGAAGAVWHQYAHGTAWVGLRQS